MFKHIHIVSRRYVQPINCIMYNVYSSAFMFKRGIYIHSPSSRCLKPQQLICHLSITCAASTWSVTTYLSRLSLDGTLLYFQTVYTTVPCAHKNNVYRYKVRSLLKTKGGMFRNKYTVVVII